MAKKKKEKDNVVVVHDVHQFTANIKRLTEQLTEGTLTYRITKASVKDDFCNYTYEITDGIGVGDVHNVKGKGIVERDMKDALSALNVHLAAIDDAFLRGGRDMETLQFLKDLRGDDLAVLYSVTGFEFKGPKDAETIILKGSKYVTCAHDRIELACPPIPLDNLSSYKFYTELKEAATALRNEVALYKEGKYTPVQEVTVRDENQGSLFEDGEEHDDDTVFEDAKMEG